MTLQEEKTRLTWMHPEHLDKDASIEEMLIQQEQDEILYWTILICILIFIATYIAW